MSDKQLKRNNVFLHGLVQFQKFLSTRFTWTYPRNIGERAQTKIWLLNGLGQRTVSPAVRIDCASYILRSIKDKHWHDLINPLRTNLIVPTGKGGGRKIDHVDRGLRQRKLEFNSLGWQMEQFRSVNFFSRGEGRGDRREPFEIIRPKNSSVCKNGRIYKGAVSGGCG